jgi:hypothetical protein
MRRSAVALAFVASPPSLVRGGKYSVNENGTQRFIYRNDVWSMSPRSR